VTQKNARVTPIGAPGAIIEAKNAINGKTATVVVQPGQTVEQATREAAQKVALDEEQAKAFVTGSVYVPNPDAVGKQSRFLNIPLPFWMLGIGVAVIVGLILFAVRRKK
jgi:disulfide bond formation protein DsbB